MKTIQGDKERAKAIVAEIIRQAGGEFENKTNLYKAFYRAHLHYAAHQPGYLSDWPIVRMPRGPGIDNFDLLLGELLAEGVIKTKQVKSGNKWAFHFALIEATAPSTSLPDNAVESIKFGVDAVLGRNASDVSYASHRDSRAWREGKDGDELNIYLDLVPDDEYERRSAEMDVLAKSIREIRRTAT